ncbi:MAG: MBL fold metallo-hydrolase [Spirochaetes bacterium]|nr:MBL fold metallo-hydrolase [Spirochaetota bacterium]
MITLLKLMVDRNRAEKQRNARTYPRMQNPDAVSSLTVLPLVDFYSAIPDAKTEAGVSYLVKAGDFTLLMDVGHNEKREHPSPLIRNMELLGVRLADVSALFISHFHFDHLGGKKNERKKTFSLSNGAVDFPPIPVYAPLPIRHSPFNMNPGSEVRVSLDPVRIAPGVYSIGSIPRALYLMGYTEEQALAVNVAGKGIVLIIGCGHQTIQRVIERARQLFDIPIYGIIGGLHFPVHGGRIMVGPINGQSLVGSDRMPWNGINENDVREAIGAISDAGVKLVSLSAHDSSDWALNEFKHAFGDAYVDLLVGAPIKV